MKARGGNLLKSARPNIPKHKLIPRHEWNVHVGDLVQITAGFKDIGKQGRILKCLPNQASVLVDGCFLQTKHMKPNPFYPRGALMKKEGAILLENIKLVDPVSLKPCMVEKTAYMLDPSNPENGKDAFRLLRDPEGKLSYLSVPKKPDPFKDVAEGPLDTLASLVDLVTWKPDIFTSPFPATLMNELERMKRKNKESSAI